MLTQSVRGKGPRVKPKKHSRRNRKASVFDVINQTRLFHVSDPGLRTHVIIRNELVLHIAGGKTIAEYLSDGLEDGYIGLDRLPNGRIVIEILPTNCNPFRFDLVGLLQIEQHWGVC